MTRIAGRRQAIEGRFNTTLNWNGNFQAAFDAVQNGGHGTMAMVGIQYQGGGSHVVLMANQNGTVGIIEGQNWGGFEVRQSAEFGGRISNFSGSEASLSAAPHAPSGTTAKPAASPRNTCRRDAPLLSSVIALD